MTDDADGKVIDLPEKFSIRTLIDQAAARPAGEAETVPAEENDDGPEGVPALDKVPPLPRPGDPYKAYARPAGRAVPTLFCIMADGTIWGFPYANRAEGPHLVPAGDAGKGRAIVLQFSGIGPVEIRLNGRRLDQLHNYLGHHRMVWVREFPKGRVMADPDAPAITGIDIIRLEP